jgi:hypothetical protein
MISRTSAKLTAEAYHAQFTNYSQSPSAYGNRTTTYKIDVNGLYDFLFEEGAEAYLLNMAKALPTGPFYSPPRGILEYVMKLHTGETLVPATPDWKWDNRLALGQKHLKDLAESLIKLSKASPKLTKDATLDVLKRLEPQLALEGYVFKDGQLYPVDDSAVNEQEEQSYLHLLIDGFPLRDTKLIKHHLGLSEEHYVNGMWGDSISNSRNFLESVLEQIADALHTKKQGESLPDSISKWPKDVRKYLEDQGFIDTTEREALAKIYGLISNTGSHPNMAHKDQARLMRNLALTFSQYILLQWHGYVRNNP